MFYLVFEIILCYFAIVGLVCSIWGFFDLYTAKKSGIALDIHINEPTEDIDAEYAARVLESIINHSALYGMTRNIVVSENFFPEHVFEKLSSQFGNLRKEE